MSEAAGTDEPLASAAAPHLVFPSKDLVCWFTDPPGIVIQFVHAVQGTAALAFGIRVEVQRSLAKVPAAYGLRAAAH